MVGSVRMGRRKPPPANRNEPSVNGVVEKVEGESSSARAIESS